MTDLEPANQHDDIIIWTVLLSLISVQPSSHSHLLSIVLMMVGEHSCGIPIST